MRYVRVTHHASSAVADKMNNQVLMNVNCEKAGYRLEASRMCPAVLPASSVKRGDSEAGTVLIYDKEGFVKLSSLSNLNAADILTVAEKTLECTEICRDWLLFPEEYVLTADTVYISEDMTTVRLAWTMPQQICSEKAAVSYFIYSLKTLTTTNGKTYLDTLGQMLECRNLRFSRVTAFINQLRQEINICGIE